MLTIQAHWLVIAAFLISLGAVSYGLWKSGRGLTLETVVEALGLTKDRAQLIYQAALVGVQMAEQLAKTGKLTTNEEQKRAAVEYVQKLFPDMSEEEIATLSETVEGAVWAVKQVGIKLPRVHLRGEEGSLPIGQSTILKSTDIPPLRQD